MTQDHIDPPTIEDLQKLLPEWLANQAPKSTASQHLVETVVAAIRFYGDEAGFWAWLLEQEKRHIAADLEAKRRKDELRQARRQERLAAEEAERAARDGHAIGCGCRTENGKRIADWNCLTGDQRAIVQALCEAAGTWPKPQGAP